MKCELTSCPSWLKAVLPSEVQSERLQHSCFAICFSDTDYGLVFDVESGIDALEPAYYCEKITAVDAVLVLINWHTYVAPRQRNTWRLSCNRNQLVLVMRLQRDVINASSKAKVSGTD